MTLTEEEKRAIVQTFHNNGKILPYRDALIEAKAEEERIIGQKRMALWKKRIVAEQEGDPNSEKDYVEGMTRLNRSKCIGAIQAYTNLYQAIGQTH